jgi:hypothetical protein
VQWENGMLFHQPMGREMCLRVKLLFRHIIHLWQCDTVYISGSIYLRVGIGVYVNVCTCTDMVFMLKKTQGALPKECKGLIGKSTF